MGWQVEKENTGDLSRGLSVTVTVVTVVTKRVDMLQPLLKDFITN